MSQDNSDDDSFLDGYDDFESDDYFENDSELNVNKKKNEKDPESRRRIEAMMAERQLARDIQEHNFDFR